MSEILSRILKASLVEASESFPTVLLLGARQTGKTTLIETVFGDRVKTFTFDPIQDLYQARKDPDLFLDQVGFPVFLDEVQYAPEVLSAIKRRVDIHKQTGMYFLSGSQNFSVMRAIKESLAGRVYIQELFPLSQREINNQTNSESFINSWINSKGKLDIEDFSKRIKDVTSNSTSITQIIWRGGFPGILNIKNSMIPGYFQSYIQTYVERDIRSLADLHSYQDFGKFIQSLAARSAKEINENELGRELGINRKTAVAWKELAINSYIWIEIPAFYGNTTKRIAGKKKGYMIDSGLICSLLKFPSPESIIGHPEFGFLYETFVFMEIWKSLQGLPLFPGISHYRTHGGAEVDFILEYGGFHFPIEVKASTNPNGNDAKGIESFQKTFGSLSIAQGIILCSCKSPYKVNKSTWAIPIEWI